MRDMPNAFGAMLDREPEARAAYGELSARERHTIMRYIQGSTAGGDPRVRMEKAIAYLKNQ